MAVPNSWPLILTVNVWCWCSVSCHCCWYNYISSGLHLSTTAALVRCWWWRWWRWCDVSRVKAQFLVSTRLLHMRLWNFYGVPAMVCTLSSHVPFARLYCIVKLPPVPAYTNLHFSFLSLSFFSSSFFFLPWPEIRQQNTHRINKREVIALG